MFSSKILSVAPFTLTVEMFAAVPPFRNRTPFLLSLTFRENIFSGARYPIGVCAE